MKQPTKQPLYAILLGGALVVFATYIGTGGLMSSFLTDEACYPQSEVDKKMAEKMLIEGTLEGKSVAEMREVLRGVSSDILDDTSLSELKKKVDDLSVLPMSEEMSPNTVHVYTEAKNNFERLTQPVVPEEPVAPVAPVVPEEPVAPVAPVVPAVVPVVPAMPVAPVEPVVPALPVAPVAPVVPAVPAKVPAVPVAPVEPVVPALPVAPVAPVVPAVPAKVPAVPVAPVEPVVPALPVAPVAPVVPAVPKQGTPAYTQYITVTKPAYDAAKKVYDAALVVYKAAKKTYDAAVAAKKKYDTVTKPAYDVARAKYDAAVEAKKEYDTVTKPAYDAAKKVYDTALVVYKAAKKTYDAAVAAKKKYDTVTKPAYDVARAKYDAAVEAKKEYDTVTKPAYDAAKKVYDTALVAYKAAKKTYDTAVAAKKKYDTVTKPAYDVARAKYDAAVEAKAEYDRAVIALEEYNRVTKPAYEDALVAYKAAVAAMDVYTLTTKPKYEADLVVYNTAVTAKKDYDDAAEEFSRIAETYRQASAPYNTYYEYKVALEEYTRAINDLLKTRIGVMQGKVCSLEEKGYELCRNNTDDDGDGVIDCADTGCANESEACGPVTCTLTYDGMMQTITVPHGTACPVCGDGTIDQNEQCDDGNTGNNDSCSSTCKIIDITASYCGDGIVQAPNSRGQYEQCDDGYDRNGGEWPCSYMCTYNYNTTNWNTGDICGDGRVSGYEACDDGNQNGGDGCSSSCQWDLMAATSSGDNGNMPKIQGCTNPDAYNFNPGAQQDNGTCETCTDGKKNGEEEDIDCGGIKCGGSCPEGCKDKNANNFDPNAKKDNGSCSYGEKKDCCVCFHSTLFYDPNGNQCSLQESCEELMRNAGTCGTKVSIPDPISVLSPTIDEILLGTQKRVEKVDFWCGEEAKNGAQVATFIEQHSCSQTGPLEMCTFTEELIDTFVIRGVKKINLVNIHLGCATFNNRDLTDEHIASLQNHIQEVEQNSSSSEGDRVDIQIKLWGNQANNFSDGSFDLTRCSTFAKFKACADIVETSYGPCRDLEGTTCMVSQFDDPTMFCKGGNGENTQMTCVGGVWNYGSGD